MKTHSDGVFFQFNALLLSDNFEVTSFLRLFDLHEVEAIVLLVNA